MTVKSQLEVYRIILPSKTTYGELIQGKFYDENSPKQTDIIKFKKLYKSFLEKLVKNNVWVYKEKKKGLTVFLEKGEQINQIITSHPNQYIIEGYLDGGRYDMIRKMAAMSDTTQRKTISSTDIVAARYYFRRVLILTDTEETEVERLSIPAEKHRLISALQYGFPKRLQSIREAGVISVATVDKFSCSQRRQSGKRAENLFLQTRCVGCLDPNSGDVPLCAG